MTEWLTSSPGYALRRAAIAAGAELSARLAEFELRQVDATVLILIGDTPGMTASAIGRSLDIQRANMVPLLKRLEDAELVERVPIDGKSQGLVLTDKGHERQEQVRQTFQDFEAELLARVAPEHREHLVPALNALWR